MAMKKTFFDPFWLSRDDFKLWISQVDGDSSSASCKLCSKTFSLSNMGEQALLSHAKGKTHRKAEGSLQHLLLVSNFYPSSTAKYVHPISSSNTCNEPVKVTSNLYVSKMSSASNSSACGISLAASSSSMSLVAKEGKSLTYYINVAKK